MKYDHTKTIDLRKLIQCKVYFDTSFGMSWIEYSTGEETENSNFNFNTLYNSQTHYLIGKENSIIYFIINLPEISILN